MKRGKSLLFIGAVIVCSLPLGSKADFSGFVEQLRESNIPIEKFLSQTGISRYEITRLLNATECKDCVNPDTAYIKKYSEKYWSDFTAKPGQYFDDIAYRMATYKQKSYYYCVAYVGENGYMRGYPRETSPICAGEFCGTRFATKAEFLQIVMNIIGKYIYSLYALDWNDVKTWLNKQDQNGYQYKNFSSTEIDTIYKKAKSCETPSCLLENTNELNIYLKYCMFNLESCGMQKIGKIGEGSWPVAELNLLERQQVINLNEAEKYDIGALIDGNLVVSIFSKVNDIVGCMFNDDYDCDGIKNTQDSCPNAYNPHQTDTDKDGFGDVCDDDIDGDGVKNPIGIVDDNGHIIPELWQENQDNCLFVVNKDQKQSYSKILGDACTSSENLSLSISITNIEGKKPQKVSFSAVYKENFAEYLRDFGDGSIGNGANTFHEYIEPGLYSVRLIAKTASKKQAIAKTTIVVGQDEASKRALQPLFKTIAIKEGASLSMNFSEIGKVDYYTRNFGNGSGQDTNTAFLQKIFRTKGNIPVTIKGYVNNQIVLANAFTIGVGNGSKGSLLQSSLLNPDKGSPVYFKTTVAGFLPRDVRTVVWNFGDGQTMQTQELNTSHTYRVSGQKVVVQTIHLADGTSLRNIVTLFVVRPYQFNSFSLNFLTPTIGSTLTNSSFSTQINGSFDSLIYFNNNYGDSKSQKFGTKGIRSPFISKHQYKNASVYYPQTNMMLDVCTTLSAQSTVDIQGSDICLEAKANGTLKTLGCDTDKDGIPDICDQDIDGDGKLNLLGISNDPKQCNYNALLSGNLNGNNNNGVLNYDIFSLHFRGVCSLDNDPFSNNPDQTDANNNNIGDTLDKFLSNDNGSGSAASDFVDTDNDAIPDSQDICPLLAETYNSILDTDGCPEIGIDLGCENTRFPSISDGLFGNGGGDGGGDGGGGCGNGKIDPGETCNNCPSDAGVCSPNCGNGKIDPGETCQTCPKDVGICTSVCGDGIQSEGETCQTCPKDANSCTPSCGNGIQESGETCQICPQDGSYCDPNCGNNTIDAGETCQTCPVDVQRCFSMCGNGIVETDLGEQCDNGLGNNGSDGLCSISCKSLGDENCGNGVQDLGEDCLTCPIDSQGCLLVATKECNQCPCPFADFSAALHYGDQIKAVLWDKDRLYPWRYSIAFEILH